MNDRNGDFSLVAVIIGGVMFLAVIVLIAGGIISWMLYRNAQQEAFEAKQAAAEARKAQAIAIEIEDPDPPESALEESPEAVPD